MQVRHGRQRIPSVVGFVFSRLVLAFTVIAIAAGSVTAYALGGLTSTFRESAVQLDGPAPPPPPPFLGAFEGGFTLLVVGTDNDADQGDDFGERDGVRNDVNILFHVSADHSSAVAVSLPRDLVITHPTCSDSETGAEFDAMSAAPLNEAYARGGLTCAATTISELTGVPIQYAAATSFNGVIAITDAVGGVDVCLTEPIDDADSGLHLPAGISTVSGPTALSFLRNPHSIGNGSDLSRIGGQQQYLASLLRTMRSGSTLGDPVAIYGLAQAAAQHIIPSTSLESPDSIVSLALTLKDIQLSKVVFVQYPVVPYVEDSNKVQPAQELADELFARILADQPITLPNDSMADGTVKAPEVGPADDTTVSTATPTDAEVAPSEQPSGDAEIGGLSGQTAAQQTCASGFSG